MYIPYAAYVILGVLALLTVVGVFTKALDVMRVPMWAALLFILAVLGGAIAPAIRFGSRFAFSVGGWLIPFILAACLLFAAGFTREMANMWLASFITAAAVFVLRYFIPIRTLGLQITAAVLIGLIAGAISYLVGRSRRGAFVSAVFGITLGELAVFIVNVSMRRAPVLSFGTAGMLDAFVIASISAVLLAHFIGELREADRRTPVRRHRPALNMEAGEDLTESEK